MIINLPIDAEKIIKRLEAEGHEAYAVGGCIRDSLLGEQPQDWDICTSAQPEEVMVCFKDYPVIATGIKHGTVTVRLNHRSYEVTTYRKDGVYLDNRRPESVAFVSSLKEDAARRDFTINAMAYNSAKGLVDYYQGCSDLKAGIIRCVGNADERFREDALRIIRAMRFASVLGFVIEKDTALSMHRNKELLNRVSRERINVELCKLLRGKGIKHILREYKDILAVIMPELTPMFGFQQNNPHHKYDVWEHTVIAVDSSINETIIRLALLLHDIGKPECYTCDSNGIGHFYSHGEFGAEMVRKILKNLKFDNLTVNNVCQLVKYHDADINESNQFIKKWLNKIGDSQFDRLLQVKYADVMGQSDYQREKKLKKLENIEKMKQQVFQESQCYSLKDLAVNGRDLIEIGIQDGKKIGEILEWLLEQVIENRLENKRGDLIKAAKSI
ncbi:CCA tRNA nucleotidyltransferase [Aminipila sp.]|uniref:CCA tRNA nucleotidyltransferase n=1 Tax=Aminipila sp. TaxID=2060095 RepID=UPI00289B8B74|nr:HD domain-containing protein [Aminipila sp.]